jgi:hypothetical protein
MQPETGIAIHYHHAWLVWALYFVGVGLHVALQVNDIAAKNGWKRLAVVNAIGAAVAYRTFGTAMLFGLLWHYPLLISNALKAVGVNIGPDEAAVLAIPMNNFVAGLYGLVLDSLLGYIPGLKSWLPSVNPPADGPEAQILKDTPVPDVGTVKGK